MEGFVININSKNKKAIISRDEMEFIQLKFGYSEYRSINDISDYDTDAVFSYCIICDERTGEVLADLSEDDYLMYQDEFECYCTSKYRRCT
ncbi:hypothetical protein [Clostridium butyricum]|uniref:Uncharacterized protein n=1 Tax=Clostridium butyricum TaxID=1492 RepID=A0AAP9REI8_CLOBU|nr:hypothetical protein [Clostridium butyricum]MBZ5746254.1 hypothetical protein [Clostridium butyricum]MDI9210080.1 hypothetical protein [Clostridium butyricum]QMW90141.1 hypothetical protein FF104_04005 [Clostridium butyricum]BBK77776.1 hypothetical protein Cbu04g_27840 [Clostridium butyricum]GEQ24748.1 hypothetical protein CBU03nite_11710 [Clostridium butyricum]